MCIHIDLIPAFKIFKGEIDVSPSYFFGRPPRIELLGTQTSGYGKPPLTEEGYTFWAFGESLKPAAVFFYFVTLSVRL